MPDEILTAQEAAEYLKLHAETVKAKARQGLLPAAKVGREWRFRKPDLDAWLSNGGTLRHNGEKA
jgi:excisionase family DNA binding protein